NAPKWIPAFAGMTGWGDPHQDSLKTQPPQKDIHFYCHSCPCSAARGRLQQESMKKSEKRDVADFLEIPFRGNDKERVAPHEEILPHLVRQACPEAWRRDDGTGKLTAAPLPDDKTFRRDAIHRVSTAKLSVPLLSSGSARPPLSF
ncbi:MAG: hypothetical protein AAF471_03910, partial [Myxococcota bacterium]